MSARTAERLGMMLGLLLGVALTACAIDLNRDLEKAAAHSNRIDQQLREIETALDAATGSPTQ